MSDGLWADVEMATVSVGDVLRVKADAYAGKAGETHNGRLVRVIERLAGEVVVGTIDMRLPFIARSHHAPYRLERKVLVCDR